MSREDWYRGTAWDRETRELFEQKLSRARPHTRAQYLRIKGLELTGSGKQPVRHAGRELLRRVLKEHPEEELQVTLALHELAQSLAEDGSLEEAAQHYRSAMQGPDDVDTHADLGLVEVILQAEWAAQYGEAADLLTRSEARHDPFPATRFRWNLAAARLADRSGAKADAKELAALALRCLDETESPFPRHRNLGLASTDRQTVRELRRMESG